MTSGSTTVDLRSVSMEKRDWSLKKGYLVFCLFRLTIVVAEKIANISEKVTTSKTFYLDELC